MKLKALSGKLVLSVLVAGIMTAGTSQMVTFAADSQNVDSTAVVNEANTKTEETKEASELNLEGNTTDYSITNKSSDTYENVKITVKLMAEGKSDPVFSFSKTISFAPNETISLSDDVKDKIKFSEEFKKYTISLSAEYNGVSKDLDGRTVETNNENVTTSSETAVSTTAATTASTTAASTTASSTTASSTTAKITKGSTSPKTGEKGMPVSLCVMAALSAAVMVACKKNKDKE